MLSHTGCHICSEKISFILFLNNVYLLKGGKGWFIVLNDGADAAFYEDDF